MAWSLTNGAIPDGLVVCHRCDVRACCNPSHLFLGTYADNTADMLRKGRQSKGPQSIRRRLTAADFEIVDARRASGSTFREIADELGISLVSLRRSIAYRFVASRGAA